jgi:cytochrome c biogenesis protein CcmG, thiol:disulfide interchange protein DsbE
MLKYLIPLVVFFTLLVLFIFGLQTDPRIVPSPFIDKPLPEINLPVLVDPQRVLSSNDLKGDISLLNIWATWCIPCLQEHPLLVDLAENNDIKIIGLNYKDDSQKALKWLDNLGDPYDIVLVDEVGTAGIDLGVYGVPETFVLDQDLIVKYKHIGPLTEKVISETILPLIDELKNGSK